MSSEIFLTCDNPECGKATRVGSDEAADWWGGGGAFGTMMHDEDGHYEFDLDACSFDCLVKAAGPKLRAVCAGTDGEHELAE